MRLHDWSELLRSSIAVDRGGSATIGVFDGVHRGHVALIDRVIAVGPPDTRIAVTFRRNPKQLLRPENFGGYLFTLRQKIDALKACGIDLCVLIDFSENFGKIAGSEFLSILARGLGVSRLVVGEDFRCGHGLTVDADGVRDIVNAWGIDTEIVPPVRHRGSVVSSSAIRRQVETGHLSEATAMLGRPYVVDLRFVRTERARGVASVMRTSQVLPPCGVYDVFVAAGMREFPSKLTVHADGAFSLDAMGAAQAEFATFIDGSKRREGE